MNKVFWSELDLALHETALDLLGAEGELRGRRLVRGVRLRPGRAHLRGHERGSSGTSSPSGCSACRRDAADALPPRRRAARLRRRAARDAHRRGHPGGDPVLEPRRPRARAGAVVADRRGRGVRPGGAGGVRRAGTAPGGTGGRLRGVGPARYPVRSRRRSGRPCSSATERRRGASCPDSRPARETATVAAPTGYALDGDVASLRLLPAPDGLYLSTAAPGPVRRLPGPRPPADPGSPPPVNSSAPAPTTGRSPGSVWPPPPRRSASASPCSTGPSPMCSSAPSSASPSAPSRPSSTAWPTPRPPWSSPARCSSARRCRCARRRWPPPSSRRARRRTGRPGRHCTCTGRSATPRSTTCPCGSPRRGRCARRGGRLTECRDLVLTEGLQRG